MYDLKITGGQVVAADQVFPADVLVREGKVAALGNFREVETRESLDAGGLLLFPGLIDTHAHLNDPGFTWREDFPHGSTAAAVGGVTTIIDMPLQNEPALTNAAVFAKKEAALSGRSQVDYAFWGGLVPDNFEHLEELHRLGVVGFKVFLGPVSPDYASLNLGQARQAMARVRRFDGLVGFHCEDYSVIKAAESEVMANKGRGASWGDFLASRPLSAELIATQAVIYLARELGARAHICHVSHPAVAELIRQAQTEELAITAETCGHYLAFSEVDLLERGERFKCAPPLRHPRDRDRLWDYVEDSTLACLASDHSPCRLDEKDPQTHGIMGAWGGISGIQNLMQVVYDQGVVRRSLSPTFLARSAASAARIFGLAHAKGAIRPGLDADLVLLDPLKPWEITPESLHYLNPFSAFTGLTGRGVPVLTLVRGEIVARDGQPTRPPGHGRLVKRG